MKNLGDLCRGIQIHTGRGIIRMGQAALRRRWSRNLVFGLGRLLKPLALCGLRLEIGRAMRMGNRAEVRALLKASYQLKEASMLTADQAFTQIAGYAQLEPGWDTYESDPPSRQAIENAQYLVLLTKKYDAVVIEWVSPVVAGVLIHLTTATGIQEWEFHNDGETIMGFRHWGEKTHYIYVDKPCFERALLR